MLRTVFALLLFCAGPALAVTPARYVASLDESSWELTESSATLCRLEHVIPRFGRAIFELEAARPVRLRLETTRRFDQGTNVELRTEIAGWGEPQLREVLARYETAGGRRLFNIPAAIAERVYAELRAGLRPGFLFYDDTPLIASLSTVQFGAAEVEFRRCGAALYRDNFDDVRVSSIYFEPDHEFASLQQEETAFGRMLEYLAINPGVREIVITGHADKTGTICYNQGLSERRAWYVHELLVMLGVDANLLRVAYAGESRPARPGNNDRIHAANRRVTVELRR